MQVNVIFVRVSNWNVNAGRRDPNHPVFVTCTTVIEPI
jgi:hypothetical protein